MNIPLHFRDFIATVVCDQNSERCMTGKCEDCRQMFEEKYSLNEGEPSTQQEFFQWKNVDGRWLKVSQKGSLSDVLQALKLQLPAFLLHTFIKRKQSSHFEAEKSKANGKHIVLQVDFAENYSIIQQNEIQSGHWAHNQVTLFTACAYTNQNTVSSYVVVSDDLVHGKFQVATFLDKIIKDIKKECPNSESIAFFSDGAASQFKQRYLFHNITHFEEDYGLKVSWNFFATSHGKGAVDGIGGNVKRLVWNATRTGAFVNNAESFAAEAANRVKNIKVFYVPSQDVTDSQLVLSERWKHTCTLPGTHAVHTIISSKRHMVRYSAYATSEHYDTHAFITE